MLKLAVNLQLSQNQSALPKVRRL